MLFNSYVFIVLFLPLVWVGYQAISRWWGLRSALGWLSVCSLAFYGWWKPDYLVLILASVTVNFGIGKMVRGKPAWLVAGCAFNLGLLGYFKYFNLIVVTVNHLVEAGFSLPEITLPLAISFFTFQQVAYLVDCHRGEVEEHDFGRYLLFVTFFPQLIAGPIVHHKEMLPQFETGLRRGCSMEELALGFSLFSFGLFKKVVIADQVAQYATPVFAAAIGGYGEIGLLEAWGGALSYTFQLYFDFSGYSDMAIGLGYLFGVRLPVNFNSPYQALSVIDFWRRWHMTLSRFLRDYLYFPLGGNRLGPSRRLINLLITMGLGGLWHGAGWTFLLWGLYHGALLILNHVWNETSLCQRLARDCRALVWRAWGRSVTFLLVVLGWVLFRAESLEASFRIFRGMFLLEGIQLPQSYGALLSKIISPEWLAGLPGLEFAFNPLFGGLKEVALLAILLAIVLWAPNTVHLFLDPPQEEKALGSGGCLFLSRLRWTPHSRWWLAASLAAFVVSFLMLGRVSEFLYFQF